ncbi:MAG: protein kinase, partial [Gammaproteobacteria bacterium]|nr:protein kinase [Gammaproteobacteria bacterium]
MITTCPHCGHTYSNIPDHAVGKKSVCTQCKQSFVITPASEGQATDTTATNEWQVGDVILDRYTVRQILGQGGFGQVYLLYHQAWDINLAVKTPNSKAIQAAGGVENFEREAETWVNLGLHPNTVSCYYVRRIDGIPRVFAEYVSGGDLHDWIRSGRLYQGSHEESLLRMIDIAIQFARGLHYAHEQKLIHQDVKPANLMLTEEGEAKVTDFGLARARAQADTHAPGQTMMVKGVGYTPEYASPEQLSGDKLTRRTDIWSWAVSLLEMFCGERTWRSGTIAGFHLDEYLASGASRSDIPAMPDDMAELLKQCFQEDPQQRPHNLELVSERLAESYRAVAGKPYGRVQATAGRNTADSLNNRAISMLDLGREQDALATWKQALGVEPYHPESTYNHGLTLWQQQLADDEPLINSLEKTMQVSQPAWLSRYLLGLVHLHRGDYQASIDVLTPISDFKDNDIDIAGLLALAKDSRSASRRILATINDEWPIHAVAVDASDEIILSGGQNNQLHVWDTYTGKILKSLSGHSSSITNVKLSSNGKTALSGAWNNEFKHWDIDAGTCMFTSKDHVASISSVCFSNDDQYILSASEDQSIRMWSVADHHSFMHAFHGHQGTVTSLAVSPDNELLLSTSEDQTVKLWQLQTGDCLQTLSGHQGAVVAADFIDADTVISAGDDQTLRIWNWHDGKCIKTLAGHSAPITAMAVSADSPYIVSGSQNGMLKIWDKSGLHCVCTFMHAHQKPITALDISRETGHVVSAGMDKAIHLWSVDKQYDFQAHIVLSKIISSESVLSAQAEFDDELSLANQALLGNQPAVAMQHVRAARALPGFNNAGEAMQLWRQLYGQLRQIALESVWEDITASEHHGPINAVAINMDGTFAITGGDDASIKLWNTRDGRCEKILLGHVGAITDVTFSACERYIVSASKDKTIKLWEIEPGVCKQTYSGHTDHVTCIAVDPNGKYLASGSADKSLKLWGLHTGDCMHTFLGHQQSVSCCWIQYDWRYLVSGSDDKNIRIWDLTSGKSVTTIGTFGGHSKKITRVCGSYGSNSLLSASEDGTLKLWDADTGNCISTINAHQQAVTSLSVSIDG